MDDSITKMALCDGEEMEVVYRRRIPLDENMPFMGAGYYGPLNPRTYMAAEDIICEQDVPVKLRDGVTIYTDIYRPKTDRRVPAIVAWSYYGKRPHDFGDYPIPGVPDGTVSSLTKVEGPDPMFWCRQGYAIANPDPRGIGNSEGDATLFGKEDGKDCRDFIDWLGERDWCNGNVGMSGNSCLSITQWFAAAERPAHLKAIAPWEGYSDLFREANFEDGVPCIGFVDFALRSLGGNNYVEDETAMARQSSLENQYWRDKQADLEKIEVPAYIAAGWSHVHLRGTVNGFERISSKQKWIRFHREFEWPDYYSNKSLEDLKRFFDRYLKGIHNGWELTPKVRLEVMDAYDFDYQTDRPEIDFPLPRTQYTTYYLDAANASISAEPIAEESSVSYDAKAGEAVFTMSFDEDTEITGHSRLRLWVEARGNDDMDLFITMLKLGADGEFIPTSVIGSNHPGAWGKLRVSHRALDEEKSQGIVPVHSHLKEEKLAPGEIVPVDIEIFPTSRIWHAGEQLQIRVAGRYIRDPWFEPHSWELINEGEHVIHTGGTYDAKLIVPIIPPRWRSGSYVYR